MRIDHYFHLVDEYKILETLNRIEGQVKQIMATQQELVAEVQVMKTKVVKIGTETRTLIERVEELIRVVEAGGNVIPELRTAIDETKEQLQIVDDLVVDPPIDPPVEP